jgi:hypothetical protein
MSRKRSKESSSDETRRRILRHAERHYPGYSHEKYEPGFFPDGEAFGSAEDAFDVGAVYLHAG